MSTIESGSDGPQIPAEPQSSDDRERSTFVAPTTPFEGLTHLRALAAIAVVALHAAVPYLRHPMPGLTWPVRDTPDTTADIAFWTIELFIMPLFLMMMGMFTHQSLNRRRLKANRVESPSEPIHLRWMVGRCRRLGYPLLFGCVAVLPFELYLWVDGWVLSDLVPARKLQSFKFDGGIDANLWGTSHLWFLVYGLTYTATFVGGDATLDWLRRRDSGATKRLTQSVSSRRLPLVGGLVALTSVSICNYVSPQIVWGFQHDFVPVASKWVYCGIFFAMGVAWSIVDPRLVRTRDRMRMWSITAIASGVMAVAMGRQFLAIATIPGQTEHGLSLDLDAVSRPALAMMAVATATASISITIAMIAWVTHDRVAAVAANLRNRYAVADRLTRMSRYIAAASLWVYIVHHPIVGLIHINFRFGPDIGAGAKWGLATMLATALSLWSYEALARRSRLGRWIGVADSRAARSVNPRPEQSPGTIPLPAASSPDGFADGFVSVDPPSRAA